MGEEAENVPKKEEKPQASKEKRQRKEKPRKMTKVIIRRLPPTMDEETFLKQVDPLPDYEQFYFVPADWSLGQEATSRAYVTLVNQDDVFLFRDRFDGYVFVDTKGAEYPAVVEFAPFQGLAKSKSRKNDPKCNTIETDLHYIAFLKKLETEASEANKQETKIEFTLPSSNNDNQVTSTPLLQYLANKKQERRDEQKRKMEEKRRQREEERQRKKDKLAKSMPKTIKEEDKGFLLAKKDPEKEDRDAKKRKDTYKESRSKRRQERDAKRREEREKNQKARAEKTETSQPKSEPVEEGEKKKEIKKYSESRRDKRRLRNSGKENEQSNNKMEKKESQDGTSEQKENSQDDKDTSQKPETEVAEMTDSVKEFIKSVANIKEFVPRNRDNANIAKEIQSNSGNEADVPKPKLTAVSVKELEESLFERRGSEENFAATENSAKDTSKEREERARRIRNKDRPSIEIYQPGKMRLSSKKEDGRSSVELKEPKSGAEADDPKSENEEKQTTRRRVSRYSERRSSRNKERSEGATVDKQEQPSVSSDRAPSAPEANDNPEGN